MKGETFAPFRDPGREYRAELVVGSDATHFDDHIAMSQVDSLLWHLAGEVSVKEDETPDEALRPGDVKLLQWGTPVKLQRPQQADLTKSNATLVFTNNRANT